MKYIMRYVKIVTIVSKVCVCVKASHRGIGKSRFEALGTRLLYIVFFLLTHTHTHVAYILTPKSKPVATDEALAVKILASSPPLVPTSRPTSILATRGC